MEGFYVRGYYGMDGLGDARPITSAIGAGLVTAGGVIAMVPAVGPMIGGIVAAVGALTSLIGGLFAPDLTKVQATHIVDQVEAAALNPLLAQWRSLAPEQKTQSAQAATLKLIDQALDAVRQGCSNPALGEAGQRCISERLIHGGTAPWCPTSTGCDWITLYRDPIANDPEVHPDPSVFSDGGTVGGSIDSAVSGVSQALGGISPLWIGVGLIVIALVALGD
jgi:uncharacterized protein (DUF697 family)